MKKKKNTIETTTAYKAWNIMTSESNRIFVRTQQQNMKCVDLVHFETGRHFRFANISDGISVHFKLNNIHTAIG